MIAKALNFVTDELNSFLERNTPARKTMAKLSGLVTPDGVVSVAENNTLVISVVNIAEEASVANQPHITRQQNDLVKKAPPVYLNIYVLISALFNEDQYARGLEWLSLAIGFFQQNAHFNAAHTAMPLGIDKLSFELVNLDVDNMSRFWGALGARYQPSVIYKMRMLTIDSEAVEGILPEFKDTN